ncbi:class I SAM-dependent methyltransferase [Laceyella tengchongensis]|jgi:hypothetical protein
MLRSLWQQHGLFTKQGDKGLLLVPPPTLVSAFIAEQERYTAELAAICADGEQLNQQATDFARFTMASLLATNQYLNFRQRDIRRLERMMRSFLLDLADLCQQGKVTPARLTQVFNKQALKVSQWLLESNGLHAFQLEGDQVLVRRVPCAEYDASFQLELLQIEPANLREPVLDIGCGAQALLVNALREQGIDAYGLERLDQVENPFIYAANWLDFHFVPDKWGTIISNMAFSNHFWHHHIRKDGDYASYAQKYMEILRSLQVGGSFVYAPGLPFVEDILTDSSDDYTVIRRPLDPFPFAQEETEELHGSRWYAVSVRRNR